MEDVKLKRCPFCGSKSVKLQKKTKFNPYRGAHVIMFVHCKHCGSRGKKSGYKIHSDNDPINISVRNEVVDGWNNRI